METKIGTATQRDPVSKYKAYQVWNDIMQRCYNPKSQRYSSYGARGIMVCDTWLSFREFLADMGERPDGFSIDRKDVNLDYTPENCRWIPLKLQAQNRRTTFWVLMEDGRRICAAEAGRELGISEGAVRNRQKRHGTIYGRRRWSRRVWSTAEDQVLVDGYTANEPVSTLAKRLNITESKIRQRLEKLAVKRPFASRRKDA